MVDPTLIKEQYAQMTDDELIHLAATEGQELTGEALAILHDEFLSRNLDTDVFGTLDDNKTARQKRNIRQVQESASHEFTTSIWQYALDEKEIGASDQEILKGLMEHGLDDEHASLIVSTLESKAQEIFDAHDSNVLRGGLTCGAGLLITIWTYSSASNGGTYVVAWGAIIFGAIRLLKGLSNKEKYKKILDNIHAEQSMGVTKE